MLTKSQAYTFVPAVPGTPFQAYRKECPPVSQSPGALPSSPVVATLTAWTVGAELTFVDVWTMDDPHPPFTSATHSQPYGIYSSNPPDGRYYAVAVYQGVQPWADGLFTAEQTGISNVGVFGKLLRADNVTRAFVGTVYDSANGLDLQKSQGLDVYAVDHRLFMAIAQQPGGWIDVGAVPLKPGDSIYPPFGTPPPNAFWSQVFGGGFRVISSQVVATLLVFTQNNGSVSTVPGGGRMSSAGGAGGSVGGGQPPAPVSGSCVTYTNSPGSESGPHEGGATGNSSTTVCFG